jgi:hypothetical protein
MNLSHHAEVRMQQRGIPALALDLLHQYGRSEWANGAEIRYFDKKGLDKAKRQVQKLVSALDKLENIYCVETSEGSVITAGHRTQPILRDCSPGKRARRR